MTEIERKALELVNEVAQDVRYEPDDFEEERRDVFKALCRAIEQHEAFRQEVSDAVIEAVARLIKDGNPDCGVKANAILSRFIIAKPDPLVETLKDMRSDPTPYINSEIYAKRLRAALAKRGLEIREKSDGE